MLEGTCLGEALRHHNLAINGDNNGNDDVDEFGGPDGNGEVGDDLDLDHDDNEDDGSPGPVDGPSGFSEVVLAQKKGSVLCIAFSTENPG